MNTETNKQTKAYIIAGIILAVLIIGVVLFLVLYNSNNTPSSQETTSGEIIVPVEVNDSIKNILVAGVDNIRNDTDIIMVVSVNSTKKTITAISLPRDTYVNPDKVGFNVSKLGDLYSTIRTRVNSTDPSGDAMNVLQQTISTSLNIKIDDYVLVNLDVFRSVVDKLDGMTFEVPVDMDYEDPEQNLSIHLRKGTQVLNGAQAEQLIRYKATYANDDIGRLGIAQQFLSQLYTKATQNLTLTEATALCMEMFNKVKTTLTLSTITSYVKSFYDASSTMRTLVIPGELTQDTNGRKIYVINKAAATSCVSEYLDPKHTSATTFNFDPNSIYTTTNDSFISTLYNKK